MRTKEQARADLLNVIPKIMAALADAAKERC